MRDFSEFLPLPVLCFVCGTSAPDCFFIPFLFYSNDSENWAKVEGGRCAKNVVYNIWATSAATLSRDF